MHKVTGFKVCLDWSRNLKKRVFINNDRLMYLLLIIISTLVFIIFYGVKVLNPTYVEPWMVLSDKSQHYLGWVGFRDSDWTFPIGLTNRITYPDYNSIIFTDSIPLLEIFFKLLSPILPERFQYFGWWTLACCILQSVIAARILKRFIQNRDYIIVASVFFAVTPILIIRTFLHESLTAHWLILLSLELFLLIREDQRKKAVLQICLIGFLASFTHIYFILICGVVIFSACIYDFVCSHIIKHSILYLLTYLGVDVFSVWVLGGFQTSLQTKDMTGFGYFSSNLNTLINPWGKPALLSDMPLYSWGEGDGSGYLGVGIFILVIVALVVFLLRKDKRVLVKKYNKEILCIAVLSILSFSLAVANVVSWNDRLIVRIPLPQIILTIWSSFRCTGRLIWILVYIIMLFGFILVSKMRNKTYALIVIVLCLAVQVYDCHNLILEKRRANNELEQWTFAGDLNERVHERIMDEKVQKVVVYYSFLEDDLYPDLMECYMWAVSNHKKTNYFYLARDNDEAFYKRTTNEMEHLSEDTIYIFQQKDKETVESYGLTYEETGQYIIGWLEE